MIDDEKFRTYIFHEDHYLTFINEIGFYAALSRRDNEQLGRIFERFEKLSEEIWGADRGVPDADEYLKNFKTPAKGTTEEELEEIQRQIRSPDLIEEDRRALLDGTEYTADSDTQEVVRPLYSTPEERWMAHLVLLSGMVKHTELIPDYDKRKYLSGVLDGWVRQAASSLSIISILAKERRVTFNGVTYRSTLPEDVPIGEIGRRLALTMPIATAKMATMFLGTEKLRRQLEGGLGEDSEPRGRQFMRIAILSDLGVDDISRAASRVAGMLKDHRFLQHVFARKLYEVAVRFRLPKAELEALRGLVADMFVSLESTPGGKVASRKANLISGLHRQRLLMDLKPKRR